MKKTILVSVFSVWISIGLFNIELYSQTLIKHSKGLDFFISKPSSDFGFRTSTFVEYTIDDFSNQTSIFTKIPYSNLQFVSFESIFRAQYEIEVLIYQGEEIKYNTSWLETIQTRFFEETDNMFLFHLTRKDIKLEPGEYTTKILITDTMSKRVTTQSNKIIVNAANDNNIVTSNIILVDDYKISEEKINSYNPVVSDSLYEVDKLYYTFFNLYPKFPNQNYNITATIENIENKNIVVSTNLDISGINQKSYPVVFNINVPGLNSGYYNVKFLIEDNLGNSKELNKTFYVGWQDLPETEVEIDLIFEQIRSVYLRLESIRARFGSVGKFVSIYYLFRDIYGDIIFADRKKLTLNEKQDIFRGIWDNFEYNETFNYPENIKNELFRRLKYVEKKYSRGRKRSGTYTDIGTLYVVFGEPDNIKQNLGSSLISNNYWVYYDAEFIFRFVDEHGFDDFRLVAILHIDTYIR